MDIAPDDTRLTDEGLAPAGTGRVLVLACGALAREIIALRDLNGWDHVDLQCLPAIWHNHPEKIAPGVAEVLTARRSDYDRIFVAYADCGTGGALEKICADHGAHMIRGPHCYAFFDGLDRFTARDEIDAFYLTDFLARQFDTFVWKPLGLDRHPQLLKMYFGHYKSLVYLAQTDEAALTDMAQAAADKMGLTFERRFTGYGELADALSQAAR